MLTRCCCFVAVAIVMQRISFLASSGRLWQQIQAETAQLNVFQLGHALIDLRIYLLLGLHFAVVCQHFVLKPRKIVIIAQGRMYDLVQLVLESRVLEQDILESLKGIYR